MTDLEKMLEDWEVGIDATELMAMAPELARKVIAAEKLAEACRHAVDCLDNGDINVADSISEPFREALAAWEAAQ